MVQKELDEDVKEKPETGDVVDPKDSFLEGLKSGDGMVREFEIVDSKQEHGKNLDIIVTVRTEDPFTAKVAAITGYVQTKTGYVWPVMRMSKLEFTVEQEDTLALPGKKIESQEEYEAFISKFPVGVVLSFERTDKKERGMTVVKFNNIIREAPMVNSDNERVKASNISW